MSPHILALDAAGAPQRWINARGAALYYATNMVAWEIGVARVRAARRHPAGDRPAVCHPRELDHRDQGPELHGPAV